jgi:glycosyltransferase involved in cell wall biosynthesis
LEKKVSKVLHVSSASTWRGGEQQISYLLKGLGDLGVSNWVFCAKNGALEQHCKSESIPYQAVSKKGSSDLTFAAKLATWCKKIQPDLIHCHDSHAHTAAVLAKTVFSCKANIVVSRRVDFPIAGNMLSKMKYNHPGVKGVFCVSKAIEEIVRKGLRTGDKAITIHSGVDLNRFKDIAPLNLSEVLAIPKEAMVIGNTSALAPHKDLIVFLKVAKNIIEGTDKEVHFILVGEGECRPELETFIAENNLKSKVHLVGFQENVGAWLKAFHLFLMTSKTEGLGTSLIDALASEIPIVATDAGGIGELIIHEKTGLLFPVGDVAGLSKGVMRNIQCDEEIPKLVQNGKRHSEEFSFNATALKTYEAYNAIVSSGSEYLKIQQ